MRITVAGNETYIGTAGSDAASPRALNQAPTVLFVHGAGFDHSVWVMPSRYFSRHGYRVLAPDLPGHGRSKGEPLPSIDAIADWLSELLKTLDVPTAALVGHSMGSLAAYTMVCRYPEQVRAVALLGTSAPMPVTPLLLNAAQDNHHAAIEMANTWSHSPAGRLGAVGSPGAWIFGAAERLLERADPGVFHTDLAACNGFDPSKLPEPSDCPALVIAGGSDQMTPAKAGAAVADKLANAKQVVLPGCGHSMLSEQPNAVLDALRTIV